jgi:hypothetical protein
MITSHGGTGNFQDLILSSIPGPNTLIIFLIYKEIQMGSVAESYMRKGFLIYKEMRKYLVIY